MLSRDLSREMQTALEMQDMAGGDPGPEATLSDPCLLLLNRADNREMFKVVRDFLYAQRVQSPVELDSDWLLVGHIDEFLTFVPAPDRKVGMKISLDLSSA